MKTPDDTSWKQVGTWYSHLTGGGGHYFHKHVVLPGVLRLLNLDPKARVLDLASGTGVLSGVIPQTAGYVGVDLADNLVAEAKRLDRNALHTYVAADVTRPLHLKGSFSHAAIILALQNMRDPAGAITNAAHFLVPGGRLVLVINHPSFRIPRQSAWGIDENSKLQYRRENLYMSPLEIPITAHPGQQSSAVTWSYHRPLSSYTAMLTENGFVIEALEEWVSDKESAGKAKKQENRARAEFPLFLAISALNGTP